MTVGRIPVIEGGIQPTIFDAKADLLTATANDTPARLAVGTNGTTLVADSTASTGLKWGIPNANGVTFYATGSQSIANNTNTALTGTLEYFDTDGYHSTSTNTSRITIPSGLGGKYLVTSTVNWDKSATGSRVAKIFKNGAATVPLFYDVIVGSSAEYVNNKLSAVIDLVAGDYIELYVIQNTGGNLLAYIDSPSGYFSAVLIGA
jgi:hypothetical protein